jgi:hypothetical protein
MAIGMRVMIDAPVLRPAGFGLYSVATVTDDGPPSGSNPPRWEMYGAEFTSLACTQADVWAVGCGPAYTVLLAKTAVASQWSADMTPNIGPYEYAVNPPGLPNDVYTAIVDGGVFTVPNANSTVVIRETGGLRRRVVITGVSNVATTGATLSGASSNQAYNDLKTGDGKSYTGADPFIVMAGVACGSLGTLNVDDQSRARAALAAGEQRAVEATFERGNIDPSLSNGAVVTPGGVTALRVKRAVGVLEQYLRAEYAGVGVIHASPLLAEYIRPDRDGNVMRTQLGTPIAFGSGYLGVDPTTGAAAPANQVWIYATGAVTVRRAAVALPATGAETLDRATNQVLMIAERGIMVAVDCVPVAAALVNLAGEDS